MTNQIYLNKLLLDHDIVCIQETWCMNTTSIDGVISVNNKKIYHKAAIKFSRTGRPSGGLGFIVNKNLKVYVNHISDRISVLKINKLIIINVYMIYDDNSKDNYYVYKDDLMTIQEIYDTHIKNNMEIMLIGDMNVDFTKKTQNTRLLSDL